MRDSQEPRSASSGSVESEESSEWPPRFESGGASYVFDARSGFFYEAKSDFFFDPKTKLYYGNKLQSYFSYCPGECPPFRMVPQQQQDESAGGQGNVGTNLQAQNNNSGAAPTGNMVQTAVSSLIAGKEKKKVAISFGSIGKKKIVGSSALNVNTTASSMGQTANELRSVVKAKAPVHAKRHAADIDKWSSKQKEIRGQVNPKPTSTKAPEVTASITVKPSTTVSKVDLKARTAATITAGQPICFLCKRKFASLEKLRQHEEVSTLHKENLKKAAAAAKPQEYRDRTKERQALFGPDHTSCPDANVKKSDTISLQRSSLITTEKVLPQETLGDSNIGNKMLQKLGWKGGNLGRKVDNTMGSSQGVTLVSEHMKKDWEKIESLAEGNSDVSYGARVKKFTDRGTGFGSGH